MKRKTIPYILIAVMLAGLVTGCTTGSAASSWPGLAADSDQVYVSYGTGLFAVDATNGSQVWSYPPEPSSAVQFFAPAAVEGDLLVVGDYANSLYGISAKNGVKSWTFDGADDKYIGGALIAQGKVYAPNADAYLYALDENGDLLWRFAAQGPNWSKPVSDGQKLYFASMDHFLYALELNYPTSALAADEGGARTLVAEAFWSADLRAAVVSEPALSANGELLIAANLAGEVFAVSSADGSVQWVYNADGTLGSIWTAPLVLGEAVFLADDEGRIFALDVASGQTLWPAHFGAGSAVIGGAVAFGDYAAFPTAAGKLIIINADKETQPAFTLEGELYTLPVSRAGKLFLAVISKEKLLVALDENGREFWTFKPQ